MVTCSEDHTQVYLLDKSIISGEGIKNASSGLDTQRGEYVVDLEFKSDAANVWADFTAANVGTQTAFTLDSEVVSAPAINEPIPGGNTQITGSFTQDSARELANVLKYGSLPLSFESSEAETVSATLGLTSLKAGLIAGAIGLALVLVYALLYYRLLGLLTALSLVAAGAMVFAILVLLGRYINYTLDLAGIAGLIIGIGTTADSFVVFFERIKDEIREGRSYRSAVPRGWARARKTILSGNAVTFIAAAVLYILAVGQVKGFAFTLGLTTILDVVVVFLVTWPLVYLSSKTALLAKPSMNGLGAVQQIARERRAAAASTESGNDMAKHDQPLDSDADVISTGEELTSATSAAPKHGFFVRLYTGTGAFDVIGKRKLWYGISGAIMAIAILSILLRGFTFGIDFEGGTKVSMPAQGANGQVTTEQVETVFSKVIGEAPESVVTVGTGDSATVQIRSEALDNNQTEDLRTALFDAFQPKGSDGQPSKQSISDSAVSETWGGQITKKALIALVVFLAIVTVYITLRYERYMAAAAMASLVFDLVVTAGVYSLVGFEVTPATVIGLLTILGFSLYDTVIVFDKVEENTHGFEHTTRRTFAEQANLAINQTFMRSINTSVISVLPIVALMVVAVWLLGVGTLQDLALVQLVGVIVGAYSSIFFATPLLVTLRERTDMVRKHNRRVMNRRKGVSDKTATADESGSGEPVSVTASVPAAPAAPAPTSPPPARSRFAPPVDRRVNGHPGGRSR